MKKAAWLFFIVLLVSLSIQAQQPQQTAIMATTDDGRRVVLLPDGKWQFVEGAPAAAPAKTGNREAMWKDLAAYFAGWPIETLDQNSGIIKTGWVNVNAFLTNTYKGKVDVVVTDSGINYGITIKVCNPETGCSEYPDKAVWEKGASGKIFPKVSQENLDWWNKIESDIKAIQTKYQPK